MNNTMTVFSQNMTSRPRDPACRLVLLAILIALSAALANGQVTVFVPGTASGDFGNPVTKLVPFVQALTVSGPGVIQIIYVSGTVSFGGGDAGPKGVPWDNSPYQSPLQEAKGVGRGHIPNLAALIGAFVPKARVDTPGFQPIDGTKNLTAAGIVPSKLFLVGTSKTIHVNGPGTLFLGINDEGIDDNSGGFTVQVTGP